MSDHQVDNGEHLDWDKAETYEQFVQMFMILIGSIDHVFTVHWEIHPDSKNSMMALLADNMKGHADAYNRLVEADKIPEGHKYHVMYDRMHNIEDTM